MSDRVVQSVNDTNESGQALQPYQSVWMSHWMRTSCDAAGETHCHSASGNKKRDFATRNDDLTNSLETSSRSVLGLGMTETKTFETADKIIETSSKSQDTDDMKALRPVFGRNLERGKAVDYTSGKGIITCNHNLSTISRCWLPKMQKCSGIRMFPSQSISSEEAEPRKSSNGGYSLLKLKSCVHDVGTKRMCMTLDALEGTPGACPGFSHTIQSLLITDKIDVNLSKENDILTSARAIDKIDGDISSDLNHVAPLFGQEKQRMKLQLLSSSIDSELKVSKVNMKNESSAETDTMEMEDSFREKSSVKNLHSGSYSTASTKAFNMRSNLPPRIGVASSRKVGSQVPKIDLPDINLKLPALPGAATLSENTCLISSKTQSLEMDKLLAHGDCQNADPGTRWVKRLKLTSSNSYAQCTKSSNMAENSSHEKVSKFFFSRILESSKTSSQPTPRSHLGKESGPSDKGLIIEDLKNKWGLLLSHAWVQRWLSNGSRIGEKKPETVVVCEQTSLNLALENLQKAQGPSIAAMALMGKALACFQPCELQKRGSFTVWNTKAF